MWQLFKFNGLWWDPTSAWAGWWIINSFLAMSPWEAGKFRGTNLIYFASPFIHRKHALYFMDVSVVYRGTPSCGARWQTVLSYCLSLRVLFAPTYLLSSMVSGSVCVSIRSSSKPFQCAWWFQQRPSLVLSEQGWGRIRGSASWASNLWCDADGVGVHLHVWRVGIVGACHWSYGGVTWLDINCRITTKCVTVPKPKLFRELNTAL